LNSFHHRMGGKLRPSRSIHETRRFSPAESPTAKAISPRTSLRLSILHHDSIAFASSRQSPPSYYTFHHHKPFASSRSKLAARGFFHVEDQVPIPPYLNYRRYTHNEPIRSDPYACIMQKELRELLSLPVAGSTNRVKSSENIRTYRFLDVHMQLNSGGGGYHRLTSPFIVHRSSASARKW
jgi:hypothetical protein